MNERKQSAITREHLCRTMREMLLEAPPGEVRDLAREAGQDAQQLAKAGRNAAERALRETRWRVAACRKTNQASGVRNCKAGNPDSAVEEHLDLEIVRVRCCILRDVQPGDRHTV